MGNSLFSSMHIPYDPDFDESVAPKPVSVFEAFSGNAAFMIGLVVGILVLAAVGFFVLLVFFIL